MPSTFSPNKGYELQATGENNGTWGIKADAVFSIIDLNFGGRFNANVAGSANVVVSSAQAQNVRHILTGVLTGNINYSFPNNGSFFIVTNNATGAFTITLLNAGGGAGIVIAQGATITVFINPDVPDIEQTSTSAGSAGVAFNVQTTAGTANAQTATFVPAVALTAGTTVEVIASISNTGPMTFAPNGLTAKAVTKLGAVALQGGEFEINALILLGYDGTQWQMLSQSAVQQDPWVVAGGTVSAITATYTPIITALYDGLQLAFRAPGANTSTTPTFAPNALTAHTITRAGGVPLLVGDIPGALAECIVIYNLANTRWELINPAFDAPQYTTLASAATTDLGTIAGPNINITGVVTITAFGTTAAVGTFKRMVFAGILTLTNNANIICLSGANITTAAGDSCEGIFTASNTFTMTSYQRKSGAALVGGSTPPGTLLNVQTFTASGTYNRSANVTKATIFARGPGGAGGAASAAASAASGGGQGALAVAFMKAIGSTETVTISSSTSTFGTWAVAGAGAVGVNNTTGGSAGGVGGTATTGDQLFRGAPGSGSMFGAAGTGMGGTGGGEGGGIAGSPTSAGSGGAAGNYGAGGGGGINSSTGGSASNGIITVYEYS